MIVPGGAVSKKSRNLGVVWILSADPVLVASHVTQLGPDYLQLYGKSAYFLFLQIRDRSRWSREQEVSKLGNCLDFEC